MKKNKRQELVSSFVNCTDKVTRLKKELEEAKSEHKESIKAVMSDSGLVKILKTTGVKTYDNQVIRVESDGDDTEITISEYTNTPSVWELKDSDDE